jgi:hypothetical protein
MGREILIVLSSEREIASPASAGMLYDHSGADWPRCSLLVTRFRGYTHDVDKRELGAARDYFGRNAEIGAGTVDLPPKSFAAWTRVGEVSEIFYGRAGTKAPGRFRHRFHKPRGMWKVIFFFKGRAAKDPVVLYKTRNAYRLELPSGCMIDDRGIAVP